MKIKYNIPKLNEIKKKYNVVKEKIEKRKESKVKIGLKYYGLLVLMILMGVISVSGNIKTYSDLNTESYKKYELDENVKVETDNVEVINYETAISSISTNVSNINENNTKDKEQTKYILPLEGKIIREYAKDTVIYSKTLEMWLIHTGIDIAAAIDTAVLAINAGEVIGVENNTFYGYTIRIKHSDGYVSVYSNLKEESNLNLGDKVKKGEVIGNVGESAYGEIEEESHLHFEITKDEISVNPQEILNFEE